MYRNELNCIERTNVMLIHEVDGDDHEIATVNGHL